MSGIYKDIFKVFSVDYGKFMLEVVVQNKKLTFLNVYGPPQDEDKLSFLAELAACINKNTLPQVLGGDFNIIRFT